jgi:hypothetical protein
MPKMELTNLFSEIRKFGHIYGMDLKGLTGLEVEDRAGLRKMVLPWTVTGEFLEDNPNGEEAANMIAEAMKNQAINDLTDLIINGDEQSQDKLLLGMDGLRKLKWSPENVVVKVHGGEVERVYHLETDEYQYAMVMYIGLDFDIDLDEFDIDVIYRTYDID